MAPKVEDYSKDVEAKFQLVLAKQDMKFDKGLEPQRPKDQARVSWAADGALPIVRSGPRHALQ